MSSILAADFGSVHTRLIMLDLVDGSYRLVARSAAQTTIGFPHNNVGVGLAHALEDITYVTGRTFLTNQGRLITPEQPDRSGVDEFVATASAGRPLRTLLVGLVPDLSIASGLRAAAGTYVEIVETFSLEDTRSADDKLNALVTSSPDLVLITGGTEGGAQAPLLELVDVVNLALKLLERPRRPVILYAGNSDLAPVIRARFADLTQVFIASNVRPTLEQEDLDAAQLQLGLAFNAFKESRGGFEFAASASQLGVLPTAQGYNLMVEYLGQALDLNTLAVDIGSAVSSLSAFVADDVYTTIRTDIGQGHSAQQAYTTLGEEAISRWLPFYPRTDEIRIYAHNKTLRPSTVPETMRDLFLEYALLRAGIEALLAAARPTWPANKMVTEAPVFDALIAAGSSLTATGNGGLSALLLLDALQPTGITPLWADPFGLLPAMGALAYLKPEAVIQVLDRTGLESLGTSICLDGVPRPDRPVVEVQITTAKDTIEQRLDGGHLWVYDLLPGQEAEVQIKVLGRGVSIEGKRRLKRTLKGGTAGLVFDMRGRPLPLAVDVPQRAGQMVAWLAEATGNLPFNLPSDWLEAPQTAGITPVRAARRLRRLDEPAAEAQDLDRLPEVDSEEETDNIRDALS